MACNERLGSRTGILDPRPVPEKPLWLFSQGLGDILEPGPHEKSKVQTNEQIDPPFRGIHGDCGFPTQVRIDELLRGMLCQNLCECLHCTEVFQLCHVT